MSEVIELLKEDLYKDEFQGYAINQLVGATQQHPVKAILKASRNYTTAATFLKDFYQSEESVKDIETALKPCLQGYVRGWVRDYVDGDPEPTLLFLEQMPENCHSLTDYADQFVDWFVDNLGLPDLPELKVAAMSELYEFISDNALEFLDDQRIQKTPLCQDLQRIKNPEFQACLIANATLAPESYQAKINEALTTLDEQTHQQSTEQSQFVHKGRSR